MWVISTFLSASEGTSSRLFVVCREESEFVTRVTELLKERVRRALLNCTHSVSGLTQCTIAIYRTLVSRCVYCSLSPRVDSLCEQRKRDMCEPQLEEIRCVFVCGFWSRRQRDSSLLLSCLLMTRGKQVHVVLFFLDSLSNYFDENEVLWGFREEWVTHLIR